jgi:hypothetical protein
MSHKENNNMGTSLVSSTLMNILRLHHGTFDTDARRSRKSTPVVKPEPQETRLVPLAESTLRRNASDASDVLAKVKPEPKDASRVVRFPCGTRLSMANGRL